MPENMNYSPHVASNKRQDCTQKQHCMSSEHNIENRFLYITFLMGYFPVHNASRRLSFCTYPQPTDTNFSKKSLTNVMAALIIRYWSGKMILSIVNMLLALRSHALCSRRLSRSGICANFKNAVSDKFCRRKFMQVDNEKLIINGNWGLMENLILSEELAYKST